MLLLDLQGKARPENAGGQRKKWDAEYGEEWGDDFSNWRRRHFITIANCRQSD